MDEQRAELEVCDNCNKSLQASKMGSHYAYCIRNFKKCEKCQHIYDQNYQQEHSQEFHKQNSLQNQIEAHQGQNMQPKFQTHTPCIYCELEVPVQQFQEHFNRCASRTRKCEICGDNILNKAYDNHVEVCASIPPQLREFRQQEEIVYKRKPNQDPISELLKPRRGRKCKRMPEPKEKPPSKAKQIFSKNPPTRQTRSTKMKSKDTVIVVDDDQQTIKQQRITEKTQEKQIEQLPPKDNNQ